MMRSLYSGISGLRNHQTRMDVIGNNIANVNTAGFKASRVVFQDIFSQTVGSGMANTANEVGGSGGTNPLQIGLGIRLASVDVLHTRSSFSRTDNPTDMMINGDGFFILGSPIFDDDGEFTGEYAQLYTRAGNFYIDDQGFLVSSHGMFVLGETIALEWLEATDPDDLPLPDGEQEITVSGWYPNPDGITTFGRIFVGLRFEDDGTPIEYDNLEDFERKSGFSVAQDGTISVIVDNRKLDIAQIKLAMFSNPGGLETAGGSLFMQTSSSGEAQIVDPRTEGSGRIDGGGLEMSNVDLASEFTDMIVTQRGFQANSRIITVSDSILEELVNLKR